MATEQIWWQKAKTITDLVAAKNDNHIKKLEEDKEYLDQLFENQLVTKDEYEKTTKKKEDERAKYSLEAFLARYNIPEADLEVPDKETMEKIAKELECPSNIVAAVFGEEPEVDEVQVVEKKKRGRKPGSVNKNKLTKEATKLSDSVAAVSSMVNLDSDAVKDIGKSLRSLADTIEQLINKKNNS